MKFNRNKILASIIDMVEAKSWSDEKIMENLDFIFDNLLYRGLVVASWREGFGMAAVAQYQLSIIFRK